MSNQETFSKQLYSESSREIKEALDFYSKHLDQATAHKERISELRQFSEQHMGMGAVQVEVAAIILWNQLTFKPKGA